MDQNDIKEIITYFKQQIVSVRVTLLKLQYIVRTIFIIHNYFTQFKLKNLRVTGILKNFEYAILLSLLLIKDTTHCRDIIKNLYTRFKLTIFYLYFREKLKDKTLIINSEIIFFLFF